MCVLINTLVMLCHLGSREPWC